MKSLIFSLFVVSNIIFLVSCKDTSPQPSDLVGNYTVTMSLRDGVVNTEAIKDSINDAMSKASEELKKARVEMNEDLNLSAIDTTTPEGKIEYAAKKFGQSFQARSKIYRIAHHGIIKSFLRSDIPYSHITCIHAYTNIQRLSTFTHIFLVVHFQFFDHAKSHQASAVCMVDLRHRRTKNGHNCIADKFVNGAFVFKNYIGHKAEVQIKNSYNLLWIETFRIGGKSTNIRK